MDRRDVIVNSIKLVGLGLLAPTLAKASEHFGDVNFEQDRSITLITTLQVATRKEYKDITPDDLAAIDDLQTTHQHVSEFTNNDFTGLINLKSLRILSIFHNQPGFLSKAVFEPLMQLETLKLDFNQFTDKLSPDIFVPLIALKVLDLSSSQFEVFPESVFTSLPQLQVLKVSTRSVDGKTLTRLKETFGDRLVVG